MSDLKNELNSRRLALQERIDDLETTLASLKAQLEEESERAQHEAIDRLEDYLGDLDNKHTNLQAFWKVLREEVRDLLGSGPDKTGSGK